MSTTSTTVVNADHDRGQQPSLAAAAGAHDTTTGDNVDSNYIIIDDLL